VEKELLPFGALHWAFWAFAFGALLWALWFGKLLEGKRIIEGKNC
jgi:hypothetical protein